MHDLVHAHFVHAVVTARTRPTAMSVRLSVGCLPLPPCLLAPAAATTRSCAGAVARPSTGDRVDSLRDRLAQLLLSSAGRRAAGRFVRSTMGSGMREDARSGKGRPRARSRACAVSCAPRSCGQRCGCALGWSLARARQPRPQWTAQCDAAIATLPTTTAGRWVDADVTCLRGSASLVDARHALRG